jgi:hypothetical protein
VFAILDLVWEGRQETDDDKADGDRNHAFYQEEPLPRGAATVFLGQVFADGVCNQPAKCA